MRSVKIFAPVALRTCRDRADAPPFLEILSSAAATSSKAGAGKVCDLENVIPITLLWGSKRRNGICVIRIGNRYRALGLREGGVVAWFWDWNSRRIQSLPVLGVAAGIRLIECSIQVNNPSDFSLGHTLLE